MNSKVLKDRLETLKSNASLSEGVQNFIKLLGVAETDEEVSKRLHELGKSSPADLIAYGKEKGFNFSKEDLGVVSQELFKGSDEFSDDDLANVAGGMSGDVSEDATIFLAVASVVLSGAGLGVSVANVLRAVR